MAAVGLEAGGAMPLDLVARRLLRHAQPPPDFGNRQAAVDDQADGLLSELQCVKLPRHAFQWTPP